MQVSKEIEIAVTTACGSGNEAPLLEGVLYPDFCLFEKYVEPDPFLIYLEAMWKKIIKIFRFVVKENKNVSILNYV